MTTTDIIAWLGAITGTLALGWDIYKWRQDGVRLAVEAVTFGIDRPEGITFTICNRGGKPTTLSEIWLTHSADAWFLKLFPLFHNAHRLFYKSHSGLKLPSLLQPGEMRTADYSFKSEDVLMDSDDYPKLIAAGELHYKIKCSHSDRCKRGLVKTPNLFA
jgi:hypothetical protein